MTLKLKSFSQCYNTDWPVEKNGPESEDSGRCAVEGCDLNLLSLKPEPPRKVTRTKFLSLSTCCFQHVLHLTLYHDNTKWLLCPTYLIQQGKGSQPQIIPFHALVTIWDVITPLSVVHHLTGSRQGNKGPLPPRHLLTGCLCWLRHTGFAGPVVAGQGLDQWRFLKSCRSAAAIQSLFPPGVQQAAPPLLDPR